MFIHIYFVLLLKVHVCICPSHSGVKTLGSADDEEDGAASWVIKMRMLEQEKKKAEKKVSHTMLSA